MKNNVSGNKTKKIKFKVPNTAALLLIVILIMGVLSYIIPAGEYDRVFNEASNRTIVVPDTFKRVEQTPVGIGGILSSVFEGLMNASDIIAFIFVVGGAFGIIFNSGAINSGLGKLIKIFSGREFSLIAVLMIAFAIGGTTFGMGEETLPFVAILVGASVALGYDKIVGASISLIGVYSGYAPGILNPFNTGIAHSVSELPMFSGMGLRLVFMIGALVISIHHVTSYAKKIKNTKGETLENNINIKVEDDKKNQFTDEMTSQHKLILAILALTIVALIFGVLKYDWYLKEIAALFMAMGLIVGIIYYRNFGEYAEAFIEGAASMTTAALLMGLSRAILVLAEQGNIMDTIVYGISLPLKNLNNVFAAWGMFFAQGVINFVIPSSSGQAVVVMPIMSAVSDIIGVTRQVAVLAYQAGDGFWNMITPTHAVVMATLGLAGISFGDWFKYALPLVIKWSLWTLATLTFAVLIGWGPF